MVAGLVDYPPGNPFYIYHTKLWTVLHQILAVLLQADVSERTLSIYLGGVVGMVSFQALSLIVYALSGHLLFAAAASGLVFFSRIVEAGEVYPIWLVGTSHTYGVIALGYVALTAGFLGAGWRRTGLFLLGAAPAVHPSLGAWFALIAVAAFLWDYRQLRRELSPAFAAFAAGCGVTAISLAVQLLFIADVPPADSGTTEKYLAAFVAFWDMHRQPVNLEGAGVKLNIAALVVGVVWLIRFAADLPRAASFLLRIVVVSAVLSLALALVSWIPPDRLPPSLLILMPARVLNINVLVLAPVVLGIAGAYRRTWWGAGMMLFVTLALVLGGRSGFWGFEGAHTAIARRVPDFVRVNSTTNIVFAAGLLLVLVFLFRDSRGVGRRLRRFVSEKVPPRLAARLEGTAPLLAVAAVAVAVWAAVMAWNLPQPRNLSMADRSDDQLFRMLSEGKGLLLTGGNLHLVQLRTRRPVLLDGGGLDALPYTLEAAPEMERILRDVYSVELFDPPEEARLGGAVPPAFVKDAWERYPRERWQAIAAEYDVVQVLTPGDWDLKLPVHVRNRTYTVYDIPHTSP